MNLSAVEIFDFVYDYIVKFVNRHQEINHFFGWLVDYLYEMDTEF